jgi:hypothetical protein
MDPCSEIVLNAADEMKNSNSLGGGVAVGTVCSISGASCDDDTDVQHVWSMQALCAGLHAITLTWSDDPMANNLDLALYDQDGEEPVEPNRPSDTKEDIEIVLGVTETYTIEVRATDTAGQKRAYTLTVDYLP